MIKHVGQLIVTGFKGREPDAEFLEFIRSENIGGVIFFEENCLTHQAAENSIKKIVAATHDLPLIAIDQEGGRVCRLKGAPAEYNSAEDYGYHNNLQLFEEQFSRAAYYIHSLGFNLFLGPVADLLINKGNQCLKGRTFGDSPARVIPFVEKAIRICQRVGLLSCLKHFPGLGPASDDPHLKMAKSDSDLQTFLNRDGLTFNAGIESGTDMVMTTHVVLPAIDKLPVTLSEMTINLLLREKLNFDGVAVTDDLLMHGLDDFGDYGERALKAFQAGHDILLFGANWKAAKAAVERIKKAIREGQLDESRLEISLNRISGIKSKLTVSAI